MTTIPLLSEHTTAIVEGLTTGANLEAGDGRKPDDAGWQGAAGASGFVGYVVVYQLPVTLDGPLADVHADLGGQWQLTSIGSTQHQAQDIADTARSWLLASGRTALVIPTRTVTSVAWNGGGGVTRDDSPPALWFGTDRYSIYTTPT